MNVLAIDQGTSATKALVLGAGGEVLGQALAAVSPRPGPGGAVVQDPQELLLSVLQAGREALAAARVPVQAVGLGNQGETVLCWDPDTGAPLGEAMSWQDRRAATITRELAERGQWLTELTGLPLDPYFAAPKMAWLARQAPGHGVITTIDAWLTRQLTGAFVTDVATASRTLLLDLRRGEWSPEACAAFGLDAERLPRIVANAEPVGETRAFGPVLPLTGLIVDQQAALLAQACLDTGEAKCTYGTGAFILANTGGQPAAPGSGLAACVAWRLDGATSFCLDGQVYTAGAAISWLRRLGLLQDPRELDHRAGGPPPGPAAPVFLPGLAGLGAPFWDPEARGAFAGLTLASDRGELVDAVLWGIAAQIALLARTMGEALGRPLARLRVDGGLTRSRRLMQAQADLLQAPVELYPVPDATARGIGALARLGAGGAATAAEAIGAWKPQAVFEPAMASGDAAAHLERFERLARALMAWPR